MWKVYYLNCGVYLNSAKANPFSCFCKTFQRLPIFSPSFHCPRSSPWKSSTRDLSASISWILRERIHRLVGRNDERKRLRDEQGEKRQRQERIVPWLRHGCVLMYCACMLYSPGCNVLKIRYASAIVAPEHVVRAEPIGVSQALLSVLCASSCVSTNCQAAMLRNVALDLKGC